MIPDFTFCGNQKVIFGAGTLKNLPEIIRSFGDKVLMITGSRSFQQSQHWPMVRDGLIRQSVSYYEETIPGEPSVDMIDRITDIYRDKDIALVVAIGGGSVLDAGKAISAMIPLEDSVYHYLEGVGNKKHKGVKIPCIAVPTTAGTGSEATKNAVISKIGADGYKKSLRHDNFVPNIALIDPALTLSCPPNITAACGLDAFTQLLESYTSINANPLTDTLAYNGLSILGPQLLKAYENGNTVTTRSAIAYGAYISGLTLANCGLGVVHGIASIIGGWYGIPHGVVCGTLIAEATKVNIDCLMKNDADHPALKKYARIGALLTDGNPADVEFSTHQLIEELKKWVKRLKMPSLLELGLSHNTLEKVAAKTNIKNNPVRLSENEIMLLLSERMNLTDQI